MFEFVCVLFFTNNLDEHLYIGHFESCAHAYNFVEENYTAEEYKWIKCLHEDYIYLPKGLVKKEIKYE